jgi:tRNA threonylcarbamoyladenosine biosynthesis protein TsaE
MSSADTDILQQLRQGIVTTSADETERIARAFAALVPENQVLAFHGDLGAGKTTFIRGLARAWDIVEPVTSPTFNLYTLYQGSRQLVHLDAYRLGSGADLDTLMIDDFLSPPWCLAVEWPERIADSLPDDAWHLHLDIDADTAHSIRLDA